MTFVDMLKQYNIPYTPKDKKGIGIGGLILLALLIVVVVAILIALFGWITMLGWNFVFGKVYPITFVQGVVLYLLCWFLFKGYKKDK